jgi:hypothetical protein
MLDQAKLNLCNDVEGFCGGIDGMVQKALTQEWFENLGEYVGDICSLACDHRVKIEAKYLAVATALKVMEGINILLYSYYCTHYTVLILLKVMEGINISLDPDLDMCSKAIPVVVAAQAKFALKAITG